MSSRIALQDLAEMLAQKTGCDKKFAENFCLQYFSVIKEHLFTDGIVKIKGWGTFKLVAVSERESIDVSTGRRIEISAHSRITFTPDKTVAQEINKPFEGFETVEVDENLEDQTLETELPEKEETPVEEQDSEIHSIYLGSDIQEPAPIPESAYQQFAEEPIEEEPELAPQEEIVPQEKEEEETPQEPQQEEPEYVEDEEEDEEKPHRKIWLKILLGFVALVLLILAYFVGYYKLLGNTDVLQYLPTNKTEVAKKAVKKDSVAVKKTPKDTIQQKVDTVAKKTETPAQPKVAQPTPAEKPISASEAAAKYPQVPGGTYLIVGTLEEHVIVVGDNLYLMAKKKYGSKEMAKYIIAYNKISNPDIIPLGMKLKLPKLVQKTK